MFLEMELESNPSIKGSIVDQNKRVPHISLVIPADKKSKFDIRQKREMIFGYRDTMGNIAVSLTSAFGFPLNTEGEEHCCFSKKVQIVHF